MTANDLTALQDLLVHPGWRLVVEMIDEEWGPAGFGAKLSVTLGNPDISPALAVAQLQQATVAQTAVQRVRRWPEDQIKKARQEALSEMLPPSRRGTL